MKILCLTARGELVPVAKQLEEQGFSCSTYILDKRRRWVGDVKKSGVGGMAVVPGKGNAGVLRALLEKEGPDFVLVDGEMGEAAEFFRRAGIPVWGGSLFGDALLSSPSYQERILSKVPPFSPGVFLGGWWTGERFSLFYEASSLTGFLPGGLGLKTTEGVLLRTLPSSPLSSLGEVLRKTAHRGPVLVKGTSLSATFSLPLFLPLLEVLEEEIPAAFGEKEVGVKNGHAGALHITLPPYPYHQYISGEAVPLPSPSPQRDKHLWYYEVIEGMGFADLGWVTARGVDVREVRRRVMRTVGELGEELSLLQYRVDFGDSRISK